MTNFYATRDNVSTTTTGYAAGSGSLALAPGAGAAFGTAFPMLVSTFLADGTPQGVYSATGRTGDTLTGLALVSGTDAALPSGATVAVRWTAEHVAQIAGAVNALETTAAGLGTASTHAAADFLTPAGNGSGLTGLTVGQVSGLAGELAVAGVPAVAGAASVTFNADGSVTETYPGGQTVTTTFPAGGSVTETFGPPISKTRTTTFSGTTITETVA